MSSQGVNVKPVRQRSFTADGAPAATTPKPVVVTATKTAALNAQQPILPSDFQEALRRHGFKFSEEDFATFKAKLPANQAIRPDAFVAAAKAVLSDKVTTSAKGVTRSSSFTTPPQPTRPASASGAVSTTTTGGVKVTAKGALAPRGGSLNTKPVTVKSGDLSPHASPRATITIPPKSPSSEPRRAGNIVVKTVSNSGAASGVNAAASPRTVVSVKAKASTPQAHSTDSENVATSGNPSPTLHAAAPAPAPSTPDVVDALSPVAGQMDAGGPVPSDRGGDIEEDDASEEDDDDDEGDDSSMEGLEADESVRRIAAMMRSMLAEGKVALETDKRSAVVEQKEDVHIELTRFFKKTGPGSTPGGKSEEDELARSASPRRGVGALGVQESIDEFDMLKKERDVAFDELDGVRDRLVKLEADHFDMLRQERDRAINRADKLEETCRLMSEEYDRMRTRVKSVEPEIEFAKRENDQLKMQLESTMRQYESSKASYEEEVQLLRDQVAKLKNMVPKEGAPPPPAPGMGMFPGLPKMETPANSVEAALNESRRSVIIIRSQLKKMEQEKKSYEVASDRLLKFVEKVREKLAQDVQVILALPAQPAAAPVEVVPEKKKKKKRFSITSKLGKESQMKEAEAAQQKQAELERQLEVFQRQQKEVEHQQSMLKDPKVLMVKLLSEEARDVLLAFKKMIEEESLPYGWEEAYTAEGLKYYIDHKTQTTSWVHPCSSIDHSTTL
eukprot:Opistho-2@91133